MGQTLSEPVTEKHSDYGKNERYAYGVSEMQGWRIGMEDAHSTVLHIGDDDNNAFFAVYDGHGGSSAAKYAGENLYKRLASDQSYKDKDYTPALKHAFLGVDDDLRADSNFFRDPSGCTAVAALVTSDKRILVANAGDSRSVLSVKGEAKPLSFDHKPQNESESSRIKAAGGFVEFGRVNGNLALSRAIGDFEFKQNTSLGPEKQIVTSDPEITEHQISDEDEFLVLACDGIWDCLTSQQVMDVVRLLVSQKKPLKEICEVIMDKCLAPDSDINNGLGCDNMTVIVVALLNGRTEEEWYDWIADRVEKQHGYETPKQLPELYSANRVAAAKERWSNPLQARGGRPGGFGALARVFGAGITFHPSGGLSNNGLMFDHDESSDDEEGEDPDDPQSGFFAALRAPPQRDINRFLREQLDDLKDDDEDTEMTENAPAEKSWTIDGDGDEQMGDGNDDYPLLNHSKIWGRRNNQRQAGAEPAEDAAVEEAKESEPEPVKLPVGLSSAPPTFTGSPLIRSPSPISSLNRSPSSTPVAKELKELQGEAPPPPKVNGVKKEESDPPQLAKTPGGDAYPDITKVEGLLDKSETPLVVNAN
ncbi:Protein phosphatase 2C 2 [Tulasnella sp. 419]|nr:Protein phosphatase 2C 2 [Tulasnella sp. 418]KAG8968768.1 Protein phosphatase 2C 2 [Tulasnella sp. 419]